MSLRRLWAVLVVALPVLGASIATMSTVDLAYHLRAGSDILAGGGIPRVDAWTYTIAGQPWLDQQWGAQILLSAVHDAGGWAGLAILRGALVGLIFGLVALAGLRAGVPTRSAVLLALAAFAVAAVSLALRPQLLGMVLFALVLVLLVERRRHPALLWLAVLIAPVWASVHGSFVFLPALLGLAWLEDVVAGRGHRALLVAVAATLATLLTPWGVDVWRYAVGLTADPNVRERVTEWRPTSITDGSGLLFYGSALLVAWYVGRRRPRPPWPVLLTLAAFFGLGVVTGRGIPWWSLVAAVTVAGLMAGDARSAAEPRGERPEPKGMRRMNALVVGILGLGIVVALPFWRQVDPRIGAPAGLLLEAPPGVTGALRAQIRPGDRVFAPQVWGSWLEYALPEATVAVDSRIELFPAAVWDAVEGVYAEDEAALEQLDIWGVTLVLTRAPDDAGLEQRLVDAGWRLVYEDADGSVVARADRA